MDGDATIGIPQHDQKIQSKIEETFNVESPQRTFKKSRGEMGRALQLESPRWSAKCHNVILFRQTLQESGH